MTASAILLPVALLLCACGQGAGNAAVPNTVETAAVVAAATPVVVAPTAAPRAQVSAAPADPALTQSHATMVAELRRLLVGTATLDGAAITDVRQIDACRTGFATAGGETTVEWAKGGNIAPRLADGREINDLPAADRTHPLSLPAGDDADGVSGAVGLLVSECAG